MGKCHNCGEELQVVPPPDNLDHDLMGRVKQGYRIGCCSKCNIPHFESKAIGQLYYFTNEERWKEMVKSLEGHPVSFFTMKKGQKWYSWMLDRPENKSLYYSILR